MNVLLSENDNILLNSGDKFNDFVLHYKKNFSIFGTKLVISVLNRIYCVSEISILKDCMLQEKVRQIMIVINLLTFFSNVFKVFVDIHLFSVSTF